MAIVHGQAEREETQNELHIEMLPGTEIMTDVGNHHFIKSEGSRRVLIPQPSRDPHDPLNWKASWKLSAIITVSIMTFTQAFAPLALAPMFPYLIEDYQSTLGDVIQFTGVTILVLGFSNFIYLNGIGAGPSEILQPAVIADLFFLHDRGKWNALYWVVYTGSLMVAPIVSGLMADRVGWHNFWWLNVAMASASIVLGIFGFPETRWKRAEAEQRESTISSATSKNTTGQHQELASGNENPEKLIVGLGEPIQEPTPGVDPSLGKAAPSKQQWWLFQPNSSPLRTIWFNLWTPWKLLLFPIVLFTSFIVSWSCSIFLMINLTQSQVFVGPPYSMSAQSIGLLNFAVLAGALIGMVTAGPFSDWVSARATTRNGGIREPEMRLPAMIPYVIIMILGNVITAVWCERRWPWPVIVVLGYSCAGIQVAALPSIASTYAVDSYRPVSGPLFVALTVNKNLWGYGMGRFITLWIMGAGFLSPFMTNMALTTTFCLIGAVFYFYGKTFRRWTKDSHVHLM